MRTASPSPVFAGRIPSVLVSVTLAVPPMSFWRTFDALVPDFADVARSQPEMDAIVARWLWYQHWDDFWAGSHAAGVTELAGACCPVAPEDSVWFCQWSGEVAA